MARSMRSMAAIPARVRAAPFSSPIQGGSASAFPSFANCRRNVAEAKPSSGRPLSWPAPCRGTATAARSFPAARRYSTPKLSLGPFRSAASFPTVRAAARCLASAKEIPLSSSARRAFRYSGLSSASAIRHRSFPRPLSLPKEMVSTTPAAFRTATPPRAKPSAEEIHHGSGNSRTRSAPPRRAIPARVHLSVRAHSPRWTQLPDMTQTTGVSPPKRRRVSAMCQAWPV